MTRKNLFLMGLLVTLLGVYVIFLSGWFATEKIQIVHNMHQARRRLGGNQPPGAPAITFGFDHPYQLTEVKVVAISALATNEHPLPAWHMVSESNSPALKMIIYGQGIQGMKPFLVNSRAQALQPGETYRLFVKAGSRLTGEDDFKVPPVPK